MDARRRFLFTLASSVLLVALAAYPAFAEEEEGAEAEEKKAPSTGLDVGDAAVDFEGREFVNSDPISLRELRGRVVLLELFSTG